MLKYRCEKPKRRSLFPISPRLFNFLFAAEQIKCDQPPLFVRIRNFHRRKKKEKRLPVLSQFYLPYPECDSVNSSSISFTFHDEKKSFTEKYLNAITWKINSNPSRKQRIWVRSCVFVTRNKSNQLSSFEPFIDSFRALYIEFFLQFVFKQKINNKPTVFKPCFVINLLSFWVNNEVV